MTMSLYVNYIHVYNTSQEQLLKFILIALPILHEVIKSFQHNGASVTTL